MFVYDYSWEGSGESEQGICTKTGKTLVKVDARYFRPAEVECVPILAHNTHTPSPTSTSNLCPYLSSSS